MDDKEKSTHLKGEEKHHMKGELERCTVSRFEFGGLSRHQSFNAEFMDSLRIIFKWALLKKIIIYISSRLPSLYLLAHISGQTFKNEFKRIWNQ